MQDKEFDLLIDKYLNNQLNIEEKDNVERWLLHLSERPSADLLTAEERAESGERIYQRLNERMKQAKVLSRPQLMVRLRPVFKIAASVFLCGFLIFGFRTRLKELFNIQQIISATNSGEQISKTILSDGSIVWLKGKSKLIYPLKFKGSLRNVELEGEALFEVAKDPSHPFVIHCGGLSTRVLGTSFNIRHTRQQIEVNVLTGRVYLSSAHSSPIILHPYQKAVYLVLRKTIVKDKEPVIEVASLIKGTEYNMLFKDAQVAEVLQRIERKFEVHIEVNSGKLMDNRITADFTDQSLLNTISMMSEAFNLNFQIDGEQVTLNAKNNNN